jgi:ribosomal protein S18 acetylase RimI-like enzyme
MGIAIRLLEEDDIETIWSASIHSRSKHPALYEGYLAEQEKGQRVVLVARCDGEFAGYGTIQWQSGYPPFAEQGIPEIMDLNVLPQFRRRGIATSIVYEAERRILEKSQIAGIGVGMYADYGPAQRMYILRGYVPDGRGLFYKAQAVIPGREVVVDDDLVLFLIKERKR